MLGGSARRLSQFRDIRSQRGACLPFIGLLLINWTLSPAVVLWAPQRIKLLAPTHIVIADFKVNHSDTVTTFSLDSALNYFENCRHY